MSGISEKENILQEGVQEGVLKTNISSEIELFLKNYPMHSLDYVNDIYCKRNYLLQPKLIPVDIQDVTSFIYTSFKKATVSTSETISKDWCFHLYEMEILVFLYWKYTDLLHYKPTNNKKLFSVWKTLVSQLPAQEIELHKNLVSVCNFSSKQISLEAIFFIKNNFARILYWAGENKLLWLRFARCMKFHHFRCNHTLIKLQEMYNDFVKKIKNENEIALSNEIQNYDRFEMHKTTGKARKNAKHTLFIKESMIQVLFSDFLVLYI